MKNIYIAFLILTTQLFIVTSFSQEIPLLSPGLTNSFLYNPSLAGGAYKTNGTVFLANKSTYSQIPGHPRSTVLSINMPAKNNKIGIGANLFIDRVNVYQTTYFSTAFAYNLQFDQNIIYSFGLSADLYYLDLDLSSANNNQQEIVDPQLASNADGKYKLDFSFGMNYQSEKLAFGGTINKLTQLFENKTNSDGSSFYSAYLKYTIPVMIDRDLIEPIVTYRQLPYSKPVGNVGLYYSYKYKNSLKRTNDGFIIGGIFISTNLQLGIMAGFKILKRVQLSYCFETSGKYQAYLGSSHELSLIANIIDLKPMDKYNEYLNWGNKKLRLRRNTSKK